MHQRDTEVPNHQSCNNLSQKLNVLVLHYKPECTKYIPILFFSPLINFCMPWRNSQTFKFVLDAATGDTSQKHETVWDLDNRDCWGENRAGVTSRSRSERVRWGNWLWAFIVIRGWGQKKAWDCGLGLARFDCSTWTKRKSTQAYLATLLPCARHKGKREVCGFKTISNHTSKNETRLLIIHESILIHTNDEKQLNKWNEGEETNLCPRIPNIF